ncbi:hypothetical protein RW25_28215 [Bacillus sp. L_1B0_8]|uniref:hypothetical protein n=1 Tax=unclassified Bacillus (in: firmicutes) TaxID=185979 RepID=UPI0005B70D25|nr:MULTISPECIES: hypothetical protein [unclassified Bacillus (in: firmicutes)]KIQ78166.1 hypothetical protein RW25_28215 [Bacillus sp. L_1B0_8]KIQ82530.1 hypothetical protein RT27_23775 [Bacillus sp. L_1B0_5]
MTISGLIDIKVPKDTFFDYKNNFMIKNCNVNLSSLVLFLKMKKVEESEIDIFNSIKGDNIEIGEDTYYWIHKIPTNILYHFPLESHEIIVPTEREKKLLVDALKHLKNNFSEGYAIVKEFIKVFIWVKIKDEYKGKDSQITSSSFPIMPFAIFLSNKAEHHIPPNNISKNSSYLFLAENIYHEAIHQAVNMNILLNDIFIDTYDSKTSPKIEIPWRSEHMKRNQFWEIDRTFHATVVYSQLIKYRISQLNNVNISEEDKLFLEEASLTGIEAAKYLSESLLEKEAIFTEQGAALIKELFEDIRK